MVVTLITSFFGILSILIHRSMVKCVLDTLVYYVLPNTDKSKNHIHSTISSSSSQGCQTIHNQVSRCTFSKGSPNHYSMTEHNVFNNHSFHVLNCIIPIHQHKSIVNSHYTRVSFLSYILFL
jgi:hypothetical protein